VRLAALIPARYAAQRLPGKSLADICGAPMVVRQGRSGQFLGCSTFPKCRGTRSMPTGVFCPKDGGELVERRSRKRGTAFYACSNEECDFVAWNKPVAETCPECGWDMREAYHPEPAQPQTS